MYRLISFSMTDGPGMAAVLFCKGCQFNCKYCYNTELRSFTKAEDDLLLEDSLDQISKLRIRDFNTVDWLILSGGEPLNKPLSELREGKKALPWCFFYGRYRCKIRASIK